ncbi:hypothetical protein COCCADRAFT_104216, partial [Bipolaris zeicola 26-R-13]
HFGTSPRQARCLSSTPQSRRAVSVSVNRAIEIKSKSRSDDITALRPPHPLASSSHDPAKPLTPFARGQTLRLERPRRRSPPIPISPRLAPASLHPRNTLFLTRTAVSDPFRVRLRPYHPPLANCALCFSLLERRDSATGGLPRVSHRPHPQESFCHHHSPPIMS